ncbi:MAG: hypothetical protein LBH75_00190 [Treponema sp.]|nr:hypothetical protein [Treponema sp.]
MKGFLSEALTSASTMLQPQAGKVKGGFPYPSLGNAGQSPHRSPRLLFAIP